MQYEKVKERFKTFLEEEKKTSQKKIFNEIWEERDHISELTGDVLMNKNSQFWHWQFLHILPKGTFPKMKTFKDNILLGTPNEHQNQEEYKEYHAKRDILNRVYYEVVYGKVY